MLTAKLTGCSFIFTHYRDYRRPFHLTLSRSQNKSVSQKHFVALALKMEDWEHEIGPRYFTSISSPAKAFGRWRRRIKAALNARPHGIGMKARAAFRAARLRDGGVHAIAAPGRRCRPDCANARFGARERCWKAERGSQKLLDGDDWRRKTRWHLRDRWSGGGEAPTPTYVGLRGLARTLARASRLCENENISTQTLREMRCCCDDFSRQI